LQTHSEGVQSILSQTPCSCIQISRRPGRIPSIPCTSYEPNNTFQIPWFHSYGLYCMFLLSTLSHACSQSSPRHPAAVSKSSGGLIGFLTCYTHATSLSPHLRYIGFIVMDSIFLLSTLSHACRGCTINDLPDTLQLYSNHQKLR